MTRKTFVIAGLGNKGSKYEGTRHNVGFLVVDELAKRWGVAVERKKWNSLFSRVQLFDQTVFFLKPMTFMNLSGKGLVEFVQFYKIPLGQIVIVHDDLDMAPGRIKLVKGGGAGGHNGIRSLVQYLGSGDFYRLKVGIGRPGQGEIHRDFPVENYVLGSLSEPDLQILDTRFDFIEEGIRFFLEQDPARAMTILNRLK